MRWDVELLGKRIQVVWCNKRAEIEEKPGLTSKQGGSSWTEGEGLMWGQPATGS